MLILVKPLRIVVIVPVGSNRADQNYLFEQLRNFFLLWTPSFVFHYWTTLNTHGRVRT